MLFHNSRILSTAPIDAYLQCDVISSYEIQSFSGERHMYRAHEIVDGG